ncbi:MAG: hypothetical protein ACKOA9_04600 [Actinomycetota bacterium]
MGPQVAFAICVVVPVLLIAVPLLLAHRKDRRAKAARPGSPGAGQPGSDPPAATRP